MGRAGWTGVRSVYRSLYERSEVDKGPLVPIIVVRDALHMPVRPGDTTPHFFLVSKVIYILVVGAVSNKSSHQFSRLWFDGPRFRVETVNDRHTRTLSMNLRDTESKE